MAVYLTASPPIRPVWLGYFHLNFLITASEVIQVLGNVDASFFPRDSRPVLTVLWMLVVKEDLSYSEG